MAVCFNELANLPNPPELFFFSALPASVVSDDSSPLKNDFSLVHHEPTLSLILPNKLFGLSGVASSASPPNTSVILSLKPSLNLATASSRFSLSCIS